MAIRPIDGDELLGITRLLDTDAVRQSKTASWLLDQVLHDIQAMPTLTQPNELLTLEQLREMDGNPTWCEEVGKRALVSVSDAGKWKDIPFALFEKNSARFEWNIEGRELSLYSYPPAHIDRSEWISVKERLPEAYYGESDNVLVVDEIGIRKILYFDGGCWCYPTGETYDRKVTHWMPLPEPPEEG